MKIFDWLKNTFTMRGKALVVYRRGMVQAKSHDAQNAIKSYSTVIEMKGAPPDVVSMALFNRGLVYVSLDDFSKGTADLNAVATMPKAPAEVKEMAKHKLVRMRNVEKRAAGKPFEFE